MRVKETVKAIYEHYESIADENRPHLGFSLAGHSCDRYLAYSFLWVQKSSFEGRMLRLFDHGKVEETRIVADLKAIGVQIHDVHPETGKQIRFVDPECAHVSGSCDGMAYGLAELPNEWAIVEFKTHNQKSFDALVKEGLKVSKHQHWIQVQLYLLLSGFKRGMYFATNKNSDEIYTEVVERIDEAGEYYLERLRKIVLEPGWELPEKLSEDPANFNCKWCDFHGICQMGNPVARNCRTCHSIEFTKEDAVCTFLSKTLPGDYINGSKLSESMQRTGCDEYVMHPKFVPQTLLPLQFMKKLKQ